MEELVIEIPIEMERVLDYVKMKYGLKTNSEAVMRIVVEYDKEFDIKESYIDKIGELENGEFVNFDSVEELKNIIDNV